MTLTVLLVVLFLLGAGLVFISLRMRDNPATVPERASLAHNTDNLIKGALPVRSGVQLLEHERYAPLVKRIVQKTGLSATNNQTVILPLLQQYAEFVQLLPASEAHHHCNPGGLLTHTLEVVDFALTYRKNYMLPLMAGAEKVNELKHVWTFGVFLMALFHDLGKPMSDVCITMFGKSLPVQGKLWQPMAGTMTAQGASHYKVDFNADRQYADHKGLPGILMQRLTRAQDMAWLSEQPDLLGMLMQGLSGQGSDKENILLSIQKKADQESARNNLHEGVKTRFRSAKQTPLIEILDQGIVRLIEAGQLQLNQPGAHGFIWQSEAGQELLLVCPRIIEVLRSFLAQNLVAGSRGIPQENLVIYGALSDYQRVVVDDASGKAIWKVQIEGIPAALSVLRFARDSASLVGLSAWPQTFGGTIKVLGSADTPQSRPASKERSTNAPDPPPVADAPDSINSSVDAENPGAPLNMYAMRLQEQAQEANTAEQGSQAGDDDLVFDVPADTPAASVASGLPQALHSALFPEQDAPAVQAQSAPSKPKQEVVEMRIKTPKNTVKPSAVAEFEKWIQLGLQSGYLSYNAKDALIHIFTHPDTDHKSGDTLPDKRVALLITPAIYQRFAFESWAKKFEGKAKFSDLPRSAYVPLQSAFLKQHPHRVEQLGATRRTIFRYKTKGGGMFQANVLTQPEDLLPVVPEANTYIAGEVKDLTIKMASAT